MDYFRINYNKLENLKQINFYKVIILILCIFILLIFLSSNIKTSKSYEVYGIYKDNILTIKLNVKLSDKIKSNEYIIFNNKKTNFKINNYGEFEIINNEIYQELKLILDEKFYDNEVGVAILHYDKKSIFKHILDLFK